jgi:hypothetical protein
MQLHGEEGDTGEVQLYSYWSGTPNPGDTNYYYFYEVGGTKCTANVAPPPQCMCL